MAMFTDIVLDKESGRHELHFVNQQYDLLMMIYFNATTRSYKLNVTEEEAMRISRYWGNRDFEAKAWLKEAEMRLSIADRGISSK